MNTITKKITGSFYTCNSVADYISTWAIDNPNSIILEPSFGDGIFIDSALSKFAEIGNNNPYIIGIEKQEKPYTQYITKHANIVGLQIDFMDYQANAQINAIIGNPPYIRLKNLKTQEREKALNLVQTYGINMQTSGSLWMPFLIHSTEMLTINGKLGFVLPYEITHVRYAFDLWKYLSNHYGKITICRIYNDFFPEVDVDTIIFLAEEKGGTTNHISYKLFETLSDLYTNNAYHTSTILIEDIINLKKPFERALIPKSVNDLLENLRQNDKLTVFINDCKFKIGYVTGNKNYFHPSTENIKHYNISSENLKKCLLNAKQTNSKENTGIETADILNYSYLFYPSKIKKGEQAYIEYGKNHGINHAYKCKVRNPWYLVPGLQIPDIILTVFGNTPKLLLNNGNFYITNSLLSGFSTKHNCKELICRWYNSLTLLSIETTIHSLGGGTLVFIPGETDKLETISNFPKEQIENIYTKISIFAKKNPLEEIYKYGDTIVLKEIYGFSNEDIDKIRYALMILRNWRNTEKRRG